MTTRDRQSMLQLIRDGLQATGRYDPAWEELAAKILPGSRPTLTVALRRPKGEYAYTLFSRLTAATFLEAIETRKKAKDQARLRDLEGKWQVLRPYLLRDESMTVEEAVRLLIRDHPSAA